MKNLLENLSFSFHKLKDVLTDFYYQIETEKAHEINELDVKHENIIYGKKYQATRYSVINRAFKELSKLICCENFNFIDLGSGKGRVLISASRFGFKHVYGIEFSEKLCKVARNNLQKKHIKNFTIISDDVLNFRPNQLQNVFFMFNPFDSVVLKKWVENNQSLEGENYLVYVNPIRDYILDMNENFKEISKINSLNSNNRIKIYMIGDNAFPVISPLVV